MEEENEKKKKLRRELPSPQFFESKYTGLGLYATTKIIGNYLVNMITIDTETR